LAKYGQVQCTFRCRAIDNQTQLGFIGDVCTIGYGNLDMYRVSLRKLEFGGLRVFTWNSKIMRLTRA